jgi:hypothetical protein
MIKLKELSLYVALSANVVQVIYHQLACEHELEHREQVALGKLIFQLFNLPSQRFFYHLNFLFGHQVMQVVQPIQTLCDGADSLGIPLVLSL